MELEEEIKQKKFQSEFQKLNLNLIFTANWIQGQYKKVFEGHGVTPSQYNVLRILKGNHPNPYTTSEIRERMLDRMSDTSRIVDRLCDKKLAKRNVCKQDRRLVDVVISNQGLNLLHEMSKAMESRERIFHSLSESQAKKINQLLDKLRSGGESK